MELLPRSSQIQNKPKQPSNQPLTARASSKLAGHQNTIEQLPTFLSFLAVAGARFPGAAALAGAAFLVGRVFYFKGYASGDPKKRIAGPAPVQYLGLLALLVMNIRFGVELVRSA